MTRMDRRSAVSLPVSAADERLHASSLYGFPTPAWTSSAVVVTASVTSHAMGAWTEMVASTGAASDWLTLAASGMATNGADTSALLDVGIGSAGSEVAVVSSLAVGHSLGGSDLQIVMPLNVPAGSRVAVRMQALISADQATIVLSGLRSAIRGRSPSSLVSYGAVTASSRGTNMPTTDTYVEIVSATAQPLAGLVIVPAAGGAISFTGETSTYTVGVGGAGAEVEVGTAAVTTGSSEQLFRARSDLAGVIPVAIPTGSRIACKQSIGRNYRDVIILGVPVS